MEERVNFRRTVLKTNKGRNCKDVNIISRLNNIICFFIYDIQK